MSTLNEGKGRCHGTARVTFHPTRSTIDLGSGPDVVIGILNAIHHCNRHGDVDDFLAVALPQMGYSRGRWVPGFEVEVFGSRSSLAALLGCEGVTRLVRRGMVKSPAIEANELISGQTGFAFVRDRSADKKTPGWHARNARRAERRGKVLGAIQPRMRTDEETVSFPFGTNVVNVRRIEATVSDSPLLVNTYGFSSPLTPAFLATSAPASENARAA